MEEALHLSITQRTLHLLQHARLPLLGMTIA
jgi:hypothetical protein